MNSSSGEERGGENGDELELRKWSWLGVEDDIGEPLVPVRITNRY